MHYIIFFPQLIALSVKLNSRCFSMKIKSSFIAYAPLYFIQSNVLQKIRPLPIFYAANWIPHQKKSLLFEAIHSSIHFSISSKASKCCDCKSF